MKKWLPGWLKNETDADVLPLPPGWQPGALTPASRQALDKPVGALLKDAPPVRDMAVAVARRLCDRVRVLPGARSGPWGAPGGGIARLTQVCTLLLDEKSIMALPPDWRLALFLVVAARTLRALHDVEVEFQDGHLWDPLSGPPSRPWRWRLLASRYPDSDWQDALWLVVDLLPKGGLCLLTDRGEVCSQLVSALTLRDQGQSLLSQLAECAEKQACGDAVCWPDTSCACEAVTGSAFEGTAQETEALCHPQQARLSRLDRESGMTAEARQTWNTLPLKQFLALVQNVPATLDGVYSEAGGLATLVCDALQIAVRIRKACALPPDEPEEQMRQGEAWNTAVWFTVLFLGIERLYHMRIFRRQGLNWLPWSPENGPLPAGAAYRGYFEHNPDAAIRALPVLYTLMPPGMLSWFRPFPLLYRAFTGALAGHASGLLVRRIAEDALQKAAEQWQRDRGLPVTPDAGALTIPPPVQPDSPVPPATPAVTTGPDVPPDNLPPPTEIPPVPAAQPQSVPVTPPVIQPPTAMDGLLARMGAAPSEQTPDTPVSVPAETDTDVTASPQAGAGQDMADHFIDWLKAGIADGSLAVNTPDALIHVWSASTVFIIAPRIFMRFLNQNSDMTDWKTLANSCRRKGIFTETSNLMVKAQLLMPDGKSLPVKGHFLPASLLKNIRSTDYITRVLKLVKPR
ncbi:TraI domain-containing protein [Klebsiella oxytoca]|uniref:TraI domain-containing protein n=1 Tax=Klebsiella oxytoca TaxID=571 RepID=UPI00385026AD